ncbi:hypothetical protein C0995_011409 [Termitomyces sp. Mi166|nr:hypothetical protein C0995_011409 [Termitomyces sp. Mi166\
MDNINLKDREAMEPAQEGPSKSNIEDVPIEDWLNITVDDEIEDSWPGVEMVVEKLLKGAQHHKSHGVIFKLQAIKEHFALCAKFFKNPSIKNPQTQTSMCMAKGVGKGSGKHHAHPSLLNDEHVAQAVRQYLTVVAIGEVNQFFVKQRKGTHNNQITPSKLTEQVNKVIILALGLDLSTSKISENGARWWLHKLGYAVRQV